MGPIAHASVGHAAVHHGGKASAGAAHAGAAHAGGHHKKGKAGKKHGAAHHRAAGALPALANNRMAPVAGGSTGGNGGLGGLGGRGQGGGLYLAGGLVTLTNDTIASNTAAGGNGGNGGDAGLGSPDGVGGNGGNAGASQGGGIFFEAGTLNLTNSTIANNFALDSFGGLAGAPGSGSPSDGSGMAGTGGGIFNDAGTLNAINTLIGDNTASVAPDFAGAFNTAQNNLLSVADGSNLAPAQPDANGNLVGSAASPIDPHLGVLTDNGGPTQTMALLPGSPAIDAGNDSVTGPPLSLTTDQRGFDRLAGAHVDIGAYEDQLSLTPPSNQLATPTVPASFNLGSFADANATATSSWNVDVNWGDGSPHSTFTATAQGSLGTLSHTYNFPSLNTVTVTLTDSFGDASQDQFQVSVGTVTFADNFNRPSSATIGANWETPPLPSAYQFTYRHRFAGFGGFQLQSNAAVSSASAPFTVAEVTGLQATNATLQAHVDASNPQTLAVGLAARIQNNNDAYVAALTHDGTAEILLFHGATNTFTVLASASAGTNTATLQFTLSGSTLSLSINGNPTPLVTANDTTLMTAGGAGIFAWGPDGMITDFSISGS
jgi:hypothetical protein